MRRNRKIFLSIIFVLTMFLISCILYLSSYYRADRELISAFASDNAVSEETLREGVTVFTPQSADKGMIFYPGGKVETEAYIPLMKASAAEGILCVLIEMPFHLAVLDVNAAEGVQEAFPQIENWYMAGHSLGGSMAASFLADHEDDFEGLILLGSYTAEDLSELNLDVLSIYGSEDRVLDRDKYEENKKLLPDQYTEHIIAGGNHAYFGMYGQQKGDGIPEISNEMQIKETVDLIVGFMMQSE